MVDIVDSTLLKSQKPDHEWITLFLNTFVALRSRIGGMVPFLKTVGDMVMFWLPDTKAQNFNSLIFFQDLIHLQGTSIDGILPFKMAIVRCEAVYDISFDERPDIYGNEVDLTSRLLSLATKGQILLNEEFYGKMKNQCLSEQQVIALRDSLSQPWSQPVKGFSYPVTLFKHPAR